MDKCREAFEKHYLSLPFHKEWSAQICLDACSFDVKQDAYLPKIDWISSNDADECVIYCCMLNTAYLSFKEQQKRIDELRAEIRKLIEEYKSEEKSLSLKSGNNPRFMGVLQLNCKKHSKAVKYEDHSNHISNFDLGSYFGCIAWQGDQIWF